MTAEELIKYYADLLIAQYRSKPKARATIELFAEIFVSEQMPMAVKTAFNLDDSIGVQLDVVGEYQGVIRTGPLLNGTLVTLNDSDFRALIELAIIVNFSEANSFEIKELLDNAFGSNILMTDYKGMRMGYFVDTAIGSSDMAQLFITSGLLPKPTGVELSSTIYSGDIDSFFGYQDYIFQDTSNRSPFNTYGSYDLNAPWLSYDDAL